MLQDLAYARTLAEEGRHAPLLGGAYLIFWGVLVAVAFTVQWAILSGIAPMLGGAAFALLWGGFGLVSIIGMTWLKLRTRSKPGLTTIGARAERAVWTGVGAAAFIIAVGCIGRMIIDNDITAPNAIPGAVFGLYGAALVAVAMLSQEGWLRNFGWIAIAVAGLVCLFANRDWAYLIAAAGGLAALAWPGFILLKREPSSVV